MPSSGMQQWYIVLNDKESIIHSYNIRFTPKNEYHCTWKPAWKQVNKGANCGRANEGIVPNVRVKIGSWITGLR